MKVDEHIDRYRNVIATLETEVAGLRRQLKNANPNSTYEEDQQKVDKYALEIQDVGHKKIRSKHSLLAVKQEKQDLIRKVAVRMRMMQNAERNGKSKEDRTAQIRQEVNHLLLLKFLLMSVFKITVIEANMANVDKKEQILFAKTETFTKELHRIRSKICQETFCQDKKLLLEREFERIQVCIFRIISIFFDYYYRFCTLYLLRIATSFVKGFFSFKLRKTNCSGKRILLKNIVQILKVELSN